MWDKLSIKDKAEIIKMGVANGIRDLNTIRDTYNNIYAEGGDTNLLNNQDFLNQYGIHWDEDPLMNDYYAQHPSELNKSTTAGMPAAYNNRVLVNRYGVPQSQQSLNRYAKDYALIQPQVSRKEEREIEKRAIDRNIEQNISQAPLLFSGLSFLNLASPVNWYGTIARQSNPEYYGEGHNFAEDLMFGNAGLFTDKWAEEHPYLSTLGNMGADAVTTAGLYKLANSGISYARNFKNEVLPINENNFYRQVSKEAIDDANKSGLIRGNRYDTDPTRGAFFRLGKYFKNPNKDTYIIEGTPNSAESWIDSWRYHSRRPFIEDEVKKLEIKKQLQPSEFTQKDEDLLSFFSELKNNSMMDVRNPSFLSKKSLKTLEQLKKENPNWLMEFGTEAFPMSEESLNVLNNNFKYWKYHKYRGWRKHNFDKVKNPVNKIEAYLKGYNKNINESNRLSAVDKHWDYQFFKALRNNDFNSAQKLRDMHFKTKAPNTMFTDDAGNPVPLWHGGPNKMRNYNPKYFGSTTDYGYYGKGLYTSALYNKSAIYKDPYMYKLYLNAENPFKIGVYNKEFSPFSWEEATARGYIGEHFNHGRSYDDILKLSPLLKETPELSKNLYNQMLNSDVSIFSYPNSKFDEVVIPDSHILKSANKITFDENGNIIPLSKRDNFNINDFNYRYGGKLIK